jgi:putative endonuclease
LRRRGFDILARNYTTTRGEIDIVARQDTVLCFIEVKTRRRAVKSTPGEAVGTHKRRAIATAAKDYLRAIGLPDIPYRFDIAEVILPRRGPIDIAYHRAAFVSEDPMS